MASTFRSALDAIIIFFCGLILFTFGLYHQEIISFESRFYLFALEMWRHGVTLFPTTYHAPYPDYPVTSTLLIYLSAKLFGGLNKFTAVLPSAIAAGFSLSATYLTGALQTRRWGWYGAGFLIFTLTFLTEARTISLDMYVTAFTSWIFYFAYKANLQEKTFPWIKVLLLLVMSFAVRGPVGMVIPASVIWIFYFLEKDWKSLILLSITGLLLLLFCTGMLLLAAYWDAGAQFLQKVLTMEVSGRLQENQTPAYYFYFVENIGAYAVTYLLAILVVLGCFPKIIQRDVSSHMRFLRALIAWVLIIMIGLSIPADKKVRYILPIAPALALISAYLFISLKNKYLQRLKKGFYLICWIFPLLALGVLSFLYQKQVNLNYGMLSVSLIFLQLVMLILQNKDAVFFLAVFTFFLVNVFVVEKINLDSNRARDFVQYVEKLRAAQHAKLGFYREGKDGWVIKYLINMQQEDNPVFISDIKDVHDVFMITSEENIQTLPSGSFKIIATGKIGHDKVVVFQ